ncbi:MAG: DUF5317 family protein [Actinomycetota bacterium]|nr:DUF5317 family protein [Actinomycetota bacterium]
MLVVFFLALAMIIAYIEGGKISALSKITLNFSMLVPLALTILLISYIAGLSSTTFMYRLGQAFYIVSCLLITCFLVLNLQIRGAGIIALGLVLNLLGIRFWFLGDILTIPIGFLSRSVFGVGDIAIGLGLFTATRGLMLMRKTEFEDTARRYRPKHLARKTA